MPYRKSSRARVQPQYAAGINYANPHAQNLIVALPRILAGVGGTLKNSARGGDLAAAGATPTNRQAASEATRWGGLSGAFNLVFHDSEYIVDAAKINTALAVTNEVTVSILCRCTQADDGGSGNSIPFDFRNAAGSNQHYPYLDGTIYMGPFGTSRWLSGATPLVNVQTPHMLTVCFKNGTQTVYQNELLIGSGSLAENPAIGAGSWYDTILTGGGGTRVYGLWLWNKYRNQGQLVDFLRDPYGTFYAPRRRIISQVSAGGGTTVALTGVSGTGAVGNLAPAASKALTGNSGIGAVGTLTASLSAALTGNTGTGAVGSLLANSSIPLTGVSGTGAVGTLTPPGDVTVALTGNAGIGTVGSLTPASAIALTGVSGVGAVGSLAAAVSKELTGASGTGAVGSVLAASSIPLTGNAGVGAVGTLTPVSGVTVALTGVSGTGAVGSLAPASSIELTGVQAVGTVGSLALPGADAVTSTPGRVQRINLPNLNRVESEDDKRARRIREGTIQPDPVAIEPASESDLDAKAAKLRAARLRIQADSARLRARIEAAEAKKQLTATAERNLVRQRQALQLKAAEEAFVVEQLEVMDVAFVAMTVIRLAAGIAIN